LFHLQLLEAHYSNGQISQNTIESGLKRLPVSPSCECLQLIVLPYLATRGRKLTHLVELNRLRCRSKG